MTGRRNILLFHQGALGDFIVTWPLALGLGRAFAQSRIFYVTSGQKGALAEKALRVECADVESGWHHLFSDDPKLPEAAQRLLTSAQCVIGFVGGAETAWTKNVKAMAPEATLITISTTPPAEFSGHITDYMLAQLKGWPIVEASMSQMLRSVAARGVGYPHASRGPIVLHPGAGSAAKCWPAERCLDLTRRLKSEGVDVEVLLGEVELEKWPASQVKAFTDTAVVRTPATLTQLLDCLAGASVYIGNDSGPGHLAAILGLPTVTIFGPHDPARWKPLGPHVCVVTGSWEEVTIERVMQGARDTAHT